MRKYKYDATMLRVYLVDLLTLGFGHTKCNTYASSPDCFVCV